MDNIELRDFLNFLSLACKVNIKENLNNIENGDIDLDELISNALISKLFETHLNCKNEHEFELNILKSKRTSKPSVIGKNKAPLINFPLDESMLKPTSNAEIIEHEHLKDIIKILKNKLNELLNEGIFDSILSYLIPNDDVSYNTNKVTTNNSSETKTSSSIKARRKDKRKRNSEIKAASKHESEVEIHVYDEVKGFKKDFKCLQSLLISNMGYFSEITKGQKLEEMDISVHCDITIFEWLMKWIKRDANVNSAESPKLDSKNVIPIMVSANFLQMRPLFQDCLYYCKMNLNEIIRFSSNLTCLSDHILKKLADKLSNTEVQYLKDRKDKIKSRLFCKLIMSLNEEEPEKHRGHYASLAYLYFCLNCGKLVTRVSASHVPCQVQCITIKYNGDVIFNHSRDPKWNINDHIKNIWTEYKNWSNTYWRLWSQCHFLYCYMCRTMYAVAFADCCPYHPQQPHFYPMEQFQTTNSPIGRYPCCGSKAIRYETIMMRSGCKLRSHIPKLQTNDDNCIQTIIDSFPELVKIKHTEENVSTFLENHAITNFDGLYRNTFMEKDSSSFPSKSQGLIKGPLVQSCLKTIQQYKSIGVWEPNADYNATKTEESAEAGEFYSIGESENSDVSLIHDISTSHKPNISFGDGYFSKHSKNETRPAWTSRYSSRHNQDNQRDYEEIFFQAMSETLLQRYEQDKQMIKKPNENTSYVMGGSYAQIESDWKEIVKTKMSKNKGKSSYVCFSLLLKKKMVCPKCLFKKTTKTIRTLYIHKTEIIYKCGFMIIKKKYISREQQTTKSN